MSVRAFRLLAIDALRDALGRRLSVVVVAVAVLGVATAESCTALGGDWIVNGERLEARLVAGWLAPFLYGFEVLLIVVLAGLLASDQLARPLRDGSAALWLARPVSRSVWAGARLAGAVGVAFGAGSVLLGASAALLAARHGLAMTPAALGALAGALAALTVAALAALASLAMGRVAVVGLVTTLVPLVTLANLLHVAGARLDGFLGAVDRLAPPLGRAVLAAVARWNPEVRPDAADPAAALVPLALWAAASLAALLLAFRRLELR